MKDSFEHPLDLEAAGNSVFDLFAEEVSSAEQMQLCCDGCAFSFASIACVSGCVSCYSTASSWSCDCS